MKKTTKNKPAKRIYLVIYDQQEFCNHETNSPVKAFRSKKAAMTYAVTRNFEFQALCLSGEEEYENYIIENHHEDYIVSIYDLKSAYFFIKEEMLRLQKNNLKPSIWEIVGDINPFKVIPVEYISDQGSI